MSISKDKDKMQVSLEINVRDENMCTLECKPRSEEEEEEEKGARGMSNTRQAMMTWGKLIK